MHSLEEITDLADFFFVRPNVSLQVDEPVRKGLLECASRLQQENELTKEQLVNVFREVVKTSKLNAKDFYMNLRKALTGKSEGPELVDIVTLLGPAETALRIKKALGVE
jgi:nondiscriminating glutamyl-tRNA synthetase